MRDISRWVENRGMAETLDYLLGLCRAHAELGGRVGQKILTFANSSDVKALCEMELDCSAAWDTNELFHNRMALGCFQKLEDLDIGVDTEQAAMIGFRDCEYKNSVTNLRFRKYRLGSEKPPIPVGALILAVREKICKVLGACPEIDDLRCVFGPGATATVPRRLASAVWKMAETPTCSVNLARSGYLPSLVRSVPQWIDLHALHWAIDDEDFLYETFDLRIARGKIRFAPKNWKTKRIIDCQPTLNGFLQSGIGLAIGSRLLDNGVDLRDQTKNQVLAHLASIDRRKATLDMRNASNLVAYEVVKTLLPDDWFLLMRAARTPSTSLNGEVFELNMFSAQGNGFTFPLETLIFWAITTVVCGSSDDVSVYGDDIICPTEMAESVMSALEAFGFEVNISKSHFLADDPFRESCGCDYFNGISVRPLYHKHQMSGESLFVDHNFYVRAGLPAFAQMVLSKIPHDLRTYGPDGYGDGHLVSNRWKVIPVRPRRVYSYSGRPYKDLDCVNATDGWEGSYFASFQRESRFFTTPFPGDLATPLYAVQQKARVPLLGVGNICEDTAVRFAKDGRPQWTVPGSEGVKVSEIYTMLNPVKD